MHDSTVSQYASHQIAYLCEYSFVGMHTYCLSFTAICPVVIIHSYSLLHMQWDNIMNPFKTSNFTVS